MKLWITVLLLLCNSVFANEQSNSAFSFSTENSLFGTPASNSLADDALLSPAVPSETDSALAYSNEDEFLHPDAAFMISIRWQAPSQVVVHWEVADEYYLYRDRLAFEALEGGTLGTPEIPAGIVKEDPHFGTVEVFFNSVSVIIPVTATADSLVLKASYQGCAVAGLCYSPMSKILEIAVPDTAISTDAPSAAPVATPPPTPALSEQDRIVQSLASDSLFYTLLLFFGFGLLLAFTPCVFPMIPILSSIIAGQGSNLSTRKAFTLSLVYVLAMAFTYAIAGVIAGLIGESLQNTFQHPAILISFALVFVLLALSMFGFYELQLPSSWQNRLTTASNQQRGGTYLGVAIMGVLSALIVGPCVAAPLAGALLYISQTQDAVLGGLALLAMGLGMGAPLLLIGTSAGHLLPKAGGWMQQVKAVFGVLLLAVAIWMLERILPLSASLLLWASLLIISAVYLGALDSLNAAASGWQRFYKGLGIILLIYGVLLLIAAARGTGSVWQPLPPATVMSSQGGEVAKGLQFEPIADLAEFEQQLALAQQQQQLVMLDFYADWCVECKKMQQNAFRDARVIQALAPVKRLKADVTANTAAHKALYQTFGLWGPPAILFFDSNGQELRQFRLVGYASAEEFYQLTQQVLNAS